MAKRKVAQIDDQGECFLAWFEEEEWIDDIPWPDDWPEKVSQEFLKEHGFEVIDV